MNHTDLLVISAYLLATLAVGFLVGRRSSVAQYWFSSRNVG